MLKRFFVCFTLGVAVMGSTLAGNGHQLHGMGPINSAMGGAGAALLTDPADALMWNPALIATADGSQIIFGTEFFEDGVRIEATLNNGTTGVANPPNQLGVLPTFGWLSHKEGSKWGFGFGLMAIAGFRTDWPEDPQSLLFNTPPDGFGRIFTDYRVTKIPFAVSYQATPKFALGFSLNAYLAELAIAPLPYIVRDCQSDVPSEDCPANEIWYPQGGNLVNEFTFAPQIGFLWEVNPKISIGGSVTTKQQYDNFEWVSTFADPTDLDPDSPTRFGGNRPLDFDLDGPLTATVGAGIVVNDKVRIAVDTVYLKFEGVSGFGSPGGVVDRFVFPFGWRDVYVLKAGVEYAPNDKWTLRGGFNYGDTPIKDRNVLTATGAPSTFQKHYTGGLSVKVTDTVSADLGFYIVPREHVRGPWPDLENNIVGSLDTSNKLTSVLVGLRWDL